MALDSASLIVSVFLLLSVVLVALAASTTLNYNRRFTKGQVRELGHWVALAMLALLVKLLTDFLVLVFPSSLPGFVQFVPLLNVFGTAFVILTAIFLIKVATLVKALSKTFGFRLK